jgi:hypothetical protein
MVIWMEDNDFDLAAWEQQMREENELFRIGKLLFEEINRLSSKGDQFALEEFLAHLTPLKVQAPKYVSEQCDLHREYYAQLLAKNDSVKTNKYWRTLPRLLICTEN